MVFLENALADTSEDVNSNSTECVVDSGFLVSTESCPGELAGGLCSEPFFKYVKFEKNFEEPPHVLVVADIVSNQGGCVEKATDRLECYPREVSPVGFKLVCSGSPVAGTCGEREMYFTQAKASWLAVDKKSCSADSAHGVSSMVCEGEAFGNFCKGQYRGKVAFKNEFAKSPHVLVVPEKLSSVGDCVGNRSDYLACYAFRDIAPEGFSLSCEGSPPSTSCRGGLSIPAEAAWIAISEQENCVVESGHFLESETCSATLRGEFCDGPFIRDVRFEKEFPAKPSLLLSMSVGTLAPREAGGSNDRIECSPENLSKDGFRAVCSGSAFGESDVEDGLRTKSSFSYLAIYCE